MDNLWIWLVVKEKPIWKIWVRQLGWLFPTEWENKKCSSHHQSVIGCSHQQKAMSSETRGNYGKLDSQVWWDGLQRFTKIGLWFYWSLLKSSSPSQDVPSCGKGLSQVTWTGWDGLESFNEFNGKSLCPMENRWRSVSWSNSGISDGHESEETLEHWLTVRDLEH